jgi:hypothetical protein
MGVFDWLKGAKCPRCGKSNSGDGEQCAHCGYSLIFHSAAVVNDNRWEPRENELATFFKVERLEGVLTKTLYVPAGARALVLQGSEVVEVPQGEYTVEGFFSRLNRLFRNSRAEILITRSVAMPIEFKFEDLHTSEFLKLGLTITASVKIDSVAAFARHFMTTPGSVTREQLHGLLAPIVRQVAAEYIGGFSIKALVANPQLRDNLHQQLVSALGMRVKDYGLAVDSVDTVELRHDKYLANRELAGSLWLLVDESRVHLEHRKTLDELYSDEEWQKIRREEEDIRLRLRRSAMAAGERQGKAELDQQEAEQAQLLRKRQVDLYEQIVAADTKEAFIKANGEEALNRFQHELADSGWKRDLEVSQWAHIQELARIRRQGELELRDMQSKEASRTEELRIANALQKIRIQNDIDQAQMIESEEVRRERLTRLREDESNAHRWDQRIRDAEHQRRLDDLELEAEERKREHRRIQNLADQVAQAEAESKDAKLKLDNLKGVMSTYEEFANQRETRMRRQAEHAAQMLRDQQDADWKRQLEMVRIKREDEFARMKLELDKAASDRVTAREAAEDERKRLEVIANLSPQALVTIADNPAKVAALAEIAGSEAFKGMSGEQILAVMVARSPNAAEALKAKYAQMQANPDTGDKQMVQMLKEILERDDFRRREDLLREDSRRREDQQHVHSMVNQTLGAIGQAVQGAVGVAQAGGPHVTHVSQPWAAPPAAPPAATPPQAPPQIYCPACHAGNVPHAKFCHNCGVKLTP